MRKVNGEEVTVHLGDPRGTLGVIVKRLQESKEIEKPTLKDVHDSLRIVMFALGGLYQQQLNAMERQAAARAKASADLILARR